MPCLGPAPGPCHAVAVATGEMRAMGPALAAERGRRRRYGHKREEFVL
jgi:hypothetical protein